MAAQVSLDGTAGVEVVLESTAVSLAALTVIGSREELDETRREIGAYQKYVLRVPNERAFATTRVHLTFPPGVRVISFDEVPEWALDALSSDGGATFTSATWTGTLPVGRFVEFAFIGVNPGEPTTLEWDAVQEYDDGTVVEWTGPVESSTPASLTHVVAPADASQAPVGSGSRGTLLGGIALALALVSLGLALRPGRA